MSSSLSRYFFFVVLALCDMVASAIETRPFSVREFKTHEIKFRKVFEREVAAKRPARESRKIDDGDECVDARRERRERERAIRERIRENERQQKELRLAQERAEKEEWQKYLSDLRASNELLSVAVRSKRERESHPEQYCGALLADGGKCPNRAVFGRWFCAEHEDPPLPKQEASEGVGLDSPPGAEEEVLSEWSVPEEPEDGCMVRHKGLRAKSEESKEFPEDESSPFRWVLYLALACVGMLVVVFAFVRKGEVPKACGRYGRISARRRKRRSCGAQEP